MRLPIFNKILSFVSGFFCGIVFCAVILEAGLRIGGWVTSAVRESRDKGSLNKKSTFHIVCLGDSSTIAGGETSYPSQLEKILNDSVKGMQFSVINKGQPAVTTIGILSQINGIIREYDPDIVVAMMGGNDKEQDAFRVWQRLRVYKFIKFLKIAAPARGVDRYIGLGSRYAAANDNVNAEKIFKRAAVLFPASVRPYIELGRLYSAAGDYSRADNAYRQALGLDPVDDYIYGMLGALYLKMGDEVSAKEFFIKAEQLRFNTYNPETAAGYLKLKFILEQKGIKLVCAQYPLRSVAPLMRIFNNDPGVVFVDNKKTFEYAVDRDGYDKYFIDRYQGDYGHCTREGNILLAGNIARAI
ncbi:MAG: hypothetical protein WC547_09765, partial [Candidatus Omnitrophota bacterium]